MANPSITNLGGDVVTFVENTTSSVLLDAGTAAAVTDSDSPDFDGGTLTISITGNKVATEDFLSIPSVVSLDENDQHITIVSMSVGDPNAVIGRVISDGSNGTDIVVQFGPGHLASPGTHTTADEVAWLLQRIGYGNSNSSDPSTLPRGITITLTDGDGGSTTVTTTVNVQAVNDAPQVIGPAGGTIFVDQTGPHGLSLGEDFHPAFSGNGKFAIFLSDAGNLVPGTTPGRDHLYLKDLEAGTITLISTGIGGAEANGNAKAGSISINGRYVVYGSDATNVVAGDTNGSRDIFMWDRVTGETRLVSANAAGQLANDSSLAGEDHLRVTDDGQFVVFASEASNLVSGDTAGSDDVFVKNMVTGAVTRASVNASGQPGTNINSEGATVPAFYSYTDVSEDGRYVLFSTNANNMVPGYDQGTRSSISRDIFLKDLQTGTVYFVSERDDPGAPHGGDLDFGSRFSRMSGDGRYVIFDAGQGVFPEPNSDLLLWDRDTGTLVEVATTSAGVSANAAAGYATISRNGQFVAFSSNATNLTPDSGQAGGKVFVKNLATGEITYVGSGNHGETYAWVSEDGRIAFYVADDDYAPGDNDERADLYSATLGSGGGVLADVALEDTLATLRDFSIADPDSGNGDVTVTLTVPVGKLGVGLVVPGFGHSVTPDGLTMTLRGTVAEINDYIAGGGVRYTPPFNHDADVPVTVTVDDGGNTGSDPGTSGTATSESATQTFIIDVIPVNDAPVIIGPTGGSILRNASTTSGNVNGAQDGLGGINHMDPLISADGNLVFFSSSASDLVAGDTNGTADVFVKNMQTGAIARLPIGLGGVEANGTSEIKSISPDGRFVVFDSDASNLVAGDTNNRQDVFLLDRQTGSVQRINVAADGTQDTLGVGYRVSSDGRFVAFNTLLSLDARDTNDGFDIYVKDMQTGTFRLASITAGGVQGTNQSDRVYPASNSDADMSDDGRYVVFESDADNFVPGYDQGSRISISKDIYLKDLVTGELILVSARPDGTAPTAGFTGSIDATMSADGRYILFETDTIGLTTQSGLGRDQILFDRLETDPNQKLKLVSTNSAGDVANRGAEGARMSRDGHYIAFYSDSTNLASPTLPDSEFDSNVFLKDLITGVTTFVGRADGSNRPDVSQNGKVVFETGIPDAPGDNDTAPDVYVADPLNGTVGAIPILEDTPSPIRVISFSDVDAGNGIVTATFTVGRGTLSASSFGGVIVSGTSTALVLTGTVAAINTFLGQDRLLYTTVLNDAADVPLAVSIDDGGNSGQDTGLTGTEESEAASANFVLTVAAFNSTPVAQDGTASGNEDTVIAGTLVATDADSSALTYRLIGQAAHGTVVVNANGSYTYTPAANYFGPDSFTFRANDGLLDSQTATISLTVNSVNDAPVAIPTSSGAEKNQVQSGQVQATDIENSPLTYSRVDLPQHGSLVFNPDGTFTYTPDLDFEGMDSFTFKANDSAADSNVATVTIFVGEFNEAPTNALPATIDLEANVPAALTGLSIADDSGQGVIATTLALQHGILTVVSVGGAIVTGSGTGTVTIEGTLAQINATLAASGNVHYTAPADFFGSDLLTMTTDDRGFTGLGGPQSDVDHAVLHLNTYVQGTWGDDSFEALAGNSFVSALPGIDTITFDFALVDATVTYRGNLVIIDGPSGHTVLRGFETYVFTDGTVQNADGDRLVDDLFYYSQNHDVWNAHVDADQHYHATGWREGRDPNAFFDTAFYLATNQDVRAAGVDPLRHFDEAGWKEGRLPSSAFDPKAYLADYPDVAGAQIDPLLHFLRHGMEENRLARSPAGPIAPDGFDFSYYLLHNPDVAQAGVDPLQHFHTHGWREGRDPNALFDVDGYLAQNPDVAAAGLDPLAHYHAFGWREGRDPSTAFDTQAYLAANPDVAAANIDPLRHYLMFGIHEGRQPLGDGVWS